MHAEYLHEHKCTLRNNGSPHNMPSASNASSRLFISWLCQLECLSTFDYIQLSQLPLISWPCELASCERQLQLCWCGRRPTGTMQELSV